MTTEHATWFGPVDNPLFGWLSVPDDGAASVGVVLCPPMTEEARATHRTFRILAERLAERGMLTLRFDYHATGDSSGQLDDPGLVQQWLGDIRAAATVLRKAGAESIALVGMRLGATLAGNAAAHVGATRLVLWDPCASGSTFLRESSALHSVRTDPTARALDEPPDGAVDTPGFRFEPGLVADLRSLDLSGLRSATSHPRHTLVLTRSDRPTSPKLGRWLSFAGVEWMHAVGQDLLLDTLPSAAAVPVVAIERIADWLSSWGAPVRQQLSLRVNGHAMLEGPGGVAITEQVARFGKVGLFGMITAPVGDAGNLPTTPWVLFLNVASEHHVGPSRQWVELARAWAALGYRCVRLDQSGIGDSPTHPGQATGVTFAREWLDDVPAVVDELRRDGSQVVVVGLCSGAYSAMETAMATDLAAIMAVNVRLSTPLMSKGTSLYDRRRRVAKPPVRPLGALARRHRKVAGGIWRIYRQFAVWHAPVFGLMRVLHRGTEVVAVSNAADAREFREVMVPAILLGRRLRRHPRFRMTLRPEVDHSLLTQRGQATVRRAFTEFLTQRFPAKARKPAMAPDAQPETVSAR